MTEFASGAVPEIPLTVLGFRGTEEISTLFSFDVLVGSTLPLSREQIGLLFGSPCALALGLVESDLVRGVVTSVRALDAPPTADMFRYVVSMAPTASLLTLTQNNTVFQGSHRVREAHQVGHGGPPSGSERVVPGLELSDVVRAVLRRYDLVEGEHYRLESLGGPTREYVVQYGESDWDFVQRWLEHDGAYYWFEHDGDRDVLVIATSNRAATPIAPPTELGYSLAAPPDEGPPSEGVVFDWESKTRRVPKRVAVFDYNSDSADPNSHSPDVRLGAKVEVFANGGAGPAFGTVVRYGEHFTENDGGNVIARVRAEQLACQATTYSGTTNCSRLRAGHTFSLTGHSHDDDQYLITAIEHRWGAALPGLAANEATHYRGSFRAIRAASQFRPALRTAWPRIHGYVQGHIAADDDGMYATMDERGRYKVRLLFDMARTRGLSSSMWIRLAQSYSGVAEGVHHPLRKGTEVLVAYMDGDPDRPVIVGTVPNGRTMSPTTDRNPTQSTVQTPSGIRIELEDHQG
jgi:type VI secretion system secreted protein VgrG